MISVITSFYNEEENLHHLYKELKEVLEDMHVEYEVILVDDGSTDKGPVVADEMSNKDSHLRVVHQRRRFGKGEGLSKGVEAARGDILVFMDADLQDNPHDIPHFYKKIQEGYDLVNGVRAHRQHNHVIKTYSKLGNIFLRTLAHSPFTDINCGFKMLKKEALDHITFYGNNFRFVPLGVFYKGYKVTEITVDNRPRKYGKAKFGMGKAFIGIMDTLTAYFLYRFSERPLHFFGMIGSIFFAIGFIIAVYLSFERIFFGMLLYRRPALQMSILFIIVGIQIIMTGIIGELIVYNHKKRD